MVLLLARGCGGLRPADRPDPESLLEQGRLYTSWLYGSQYQKLWDRFSPDMRQTFGSVGDLASFAGRAVTRLGPEKARGGRAGVRRRAVPGLQPEGIVRHVATPDADRVEPGQGRRGDRPGGAAGARRFP